MAGDGCRWREGLVFFSCGAVVDCPVTGSTNCTKRVMKEEEEEKEMKVELGVGEKIWGWI